MSSSDRSYGNGRYQILKRLGAGGMGQVFLAEDAVLDRFVALKILATHAVGDPEYGRRLAYEAKVMGRLHHPGIVTIFDAFTEQDDLCLVLEYIEGMNFREFLGQGCFTVDFGHRMIHELGRALSYLHDGHDVVHRDLKPENILIGLDGRIKLVDFGIARRTTDDRLTKDGVVIGTKSYIAPEVMAGDPATSASDVWSLGAVMHEAYEQLASRPGATTALAARKIISQMLQRDPALRPSPQDLASAEFTDPGTDEAASEHTAATTLQPPVTTPTLPLTRRVLVEPAVLLGSLSQAERQEQLLRWISHKVTHIWVRDASRGTAWRRLEIAEELSPRLGIRSSSSSYHYLLWGDTGQERIWQVSPETAMARKLPFQPVKDGIFSFTERYFTAEMDRVVYEWCENEALAYQGLKNRRVRQLKWDIYRSGSYKRNGWGLDSAERIQLWGYSELFGRELSRPLILKGLPEMRHAVIEGDKVALLSKLGTVFLVREGPGPQGSRGPGRDWHAVDIPFPRMVEHLSLEGGQLLATGRSGTIWGVDLSQDECGGNVTVLAENVAFKRFCPGGFVTEDGRLRLLHPLRTPELPPGLISTVVSDELVITTAER